MNIMNDILWESDFQFVQFHYSDITLVRDQVTGKNSRTNPKYR